MLFPCPEFVKKLIEYLERFFAKLDHTHQGLGPIVGEIKLWAGSTIPENWLLCNGTGYLKSGYPELTEALGPAFWSGDYVFVPDLRNKFIVGAGDTYALLQQGGEASHTLTVSEMPSHSHDLAYIYARGDGASWVTAHYTYPSPNGFFNDAVSFSGGGDPHNNLPPFYGLYFIIYAARPEDTGGGG